MSLSSDELSKNAMGGTELMKAALQQKIDPELFDKFHITASRYRGPSESGNKIELYWLHDLPQDPESKHLEQGGWNKFEKLVFVSNWQFQQYQAYYGLPWYKCIVMQNAIEPIIPNKPNDGIIRLIYHTTPHRGLELVAPVFAKLCEKYDNIELDVYSSFKAYGWEERDEPYKPLFDFCENHPKINYHGYQPNSVVRDALATADIFAYPSIWQETSCISMMEAMSARCEIVHPNLAALYETAANWTTMYQWVQDKKDHAKIFYSVLDSVIENYNGEATQSRLQSQKSYADVFYSWTLRSLQWEQLLRSVVWSKEMMDNKEK
jgi:UDP-glucose:(glucosyl)LPS alpha-1,2-glucosyltransferase